MLAGKLAQANTALPHFFALRAHIHKHITQPHWMRVWKALSWAFSLFIFAGRRWKKYAWVFLKIIDLRTWWAPTTSSDFSLKTLINAASGKNHLQSEWMSLESRREKAHRPSLISCYVWLSSQTPLPYTNFIPIWVDGRHYYYRNMSSIVGGEYSWRRSISIYGNH